MRLVDVVFSFTETLIALAAVAVLGPSLTNAMIAVGIAAIPFYARVAYSVTLVERNRAYFDAAYVAGAGHFRLVFVHLLPNILPPLIVVATLGVSSAVLAAAGLSFLGLGAQPPSPEWGAMLSAGRDYFTQASWIMIYPGRRDHGHSAGVQPIGRRHPRGARSQAEGEAMTDLAEQDHAAQAPQNRDTVLSVQNLSTEFRSKRGNVRRRRHVLRPQKGRDPVDCGRVGLGQERHVSVDHAASALSRGSHRQRPDAVRGPRPRQHCRIARCAGCARRGSR